jgi:hypothetical protein
MATSPRILGIEWGGIEVEDLGRGRDVKLWPGGGRDWDWRETGTHHVPGIQVADVQELLDHGSEIVVLSRGMRLRLQTAEETLEFLEKRSVSCRVAETKEAVRIYNELSARGERGGRALPHHLLSARTNVPDPPAVDRMTGARH